MKKSIFNSNLFTQLLLFLLSAAFVIAAVMICGLIFQVDDYSSASWAYKASLEEAAPVAPFNPETDFYNDMGTVYVDPANLEKTADNLTVVKNFDSKLSVPTYVYKYDDTWFIVDCYHNRVIYNDNMTDPLKEWSIMSADANNPHTIASDGQVYLIDDTEMGRELVYEKVNGKFVKTQVLFGVGLRPHYTIYDKKSDTFYIWSSMTGELFCYRHPADSTRMYRTAVKTLPELAGTYVRSFTICGDYAYFVSGVSDDSTSQLLCCKLDTMEIVARYDVPDELSGMVQIVPIEDYFYITISTDSTGDQDYATIIRTKSLKSLSKGIYYEIYNKYFVGGGTPYYITHVDDTYYLTEHRLTDTQIWGFNVDKHGNIKNVKSIY